MPPLPLPAMGPHLIDSQVGAGVRDDAEHVGQVATVEGAGALPLQDLPGAVQQPLVLARPAEGQPRLQHLGRTQLSLGSCLQNYYVQE